MDSSSDLFWAVGDVVSAASDVAWNWNDFRTRRALVDALERLEGIVGGASDINPW